MSKLKTFFKKIGAELTLLLKGNLPNGWEAITEDLINGLNMAKTFLAKPGVATLAALFPDGLGTLALDAVEKVINDGIPTLEIAQGAEQAVAGISDPTAKANALVQYLLTNIGKLPSDFQGKHWQDVARQILTALLNITDTEANALINVKYGQMTA